MAQNFVGSNNINLLYPAGQFGSRAMGGSDASSPRYIFTRLCPVARCVWLGVMSMYGCQVRLAWCDVFDCQVRLAWCDVLGCYVRLA